MPPAATVIIPTRNRQQILLETIGSILQQSVPLEVLVMDDGSIDRTVDAVRAAFPKVQVHRSETSAGPTRRRNDGAALASTPFLFTIDDDILLPSPNTFRQTLDAFDDVRIGAVTIPFVNVHQNNVVQFAAPDDRQAYITSMFYGGMVAFRREAYLAVGGYRTFYLHARGRAGPLPSPARTRVPHPARDRGPNPSSGIGYPRPPAAQRAGGAELGALPLVQHALAGGGGADVRGPG